jgi:hypothetical protein
VNDVSRLSTEYERALDALRDVVARGAEAASSSRRARLDAEVVKLTERLARVARRPDEPSGVAPVVKFTKRFATRGTLYDYAGVRGSDGWWYLTSRDGAPAQDRALTWDELLDFVYDRFGSEQTLRVGVEWQMLITD